jgi:DNA-binding HxlR family transcriptional regulator
VKRTSLDHLDCSIARALDVVGEWWTLLVIRDITFGNRRFDGIQANLGVARNVLADRLATLVDHGVLERRRYQDHPERFEYVLTDMGRDLYPVLLMLMRWGDTYLSPDGPPALVRHTGCGHDTVPTLACSQCGEPLGNREIRVHPGPGWRRPGAAEVAEAV